MDTDKSNISNTDKSNISNIVFVIDATVSMDNWLVAVKKSVTELFAIALISGKHISIRFVIFRDYNYLNNSNIIIQDSCNLLDISSELKNIHDTITFLNNVKQIGNSDFQEAIKTGLFKCHNKFKNRKLSSRYDRKKLYHIYTRTTRI